MKLICGLVLVFAIYCAEAKSFGAQLNKRDIASQAELLAKLAALLGKSNGVIAELEKQGKPLLAAGIKKLEDVLKGLEEKVKNANPHTELGKLALKALDELIKAAENKLEEELKKIGAKSEHSLEKRDIASQAELLLKLANMLSKSKLAQEILAKEGKPLLAAGLKKIDEMLHSLDEKVRKANPHTELGKMALKGLDWLIQHAEHLLESELAKIQGQSTTAKPAFYEDIDTKDGLLKLAQSLRNTAKKAIDFLKAQGKSLEAGELELLVTVISDIEHKLETIQPHTELGKMLLTGLEALLKNSETKLNDILKKLNAHP